MENEIKSHYSYTEVINWLEAKDLIVRGDSSLRMVWSDS